VGHPVVGVGAEEPAVQRCRAEGEPIGVLGDVGAETSELAGQGGQPVGLVVADVADPAQVAGGRGQGAQRGDDRGQLADVVQVDVEALEGAGRGAGDPQPVGGVLDRPGWSPTASRGR
jgi:hypothetical protein